MKNFLLFLALWWFLPCPGKAQLTLDECLQAARENYPLIKQHDLIRRSAEYTVQNARSSWYPQISLSAQATYQSDVMSFPAEMEQLYSRLGISFEGLPKDQYKATVDIRQNLYDGGATKAHIRSARAEEEVRAQTWEVDMYALRDRVHSLYFGILTLDARLQQCDLLQEELRRNLDLVRSYQKNGLALPGDVELVEVEILASDQQKVELASARDAFRLMLGAVIGRNIPAETAFATPPAEASAEGILRPELLLFSAQSAQIGQQERIVRAGLMPRVGVFFSGNYGNPGLNLFEDMRENRFSAYYVAGLSVSWNLSNFYTKRNDLRKISIARQEVDVRRNTFLYQIQQTVLQQQGAVRKMQEVMQSDRRIIDLRTSIKTATAAKVKNGTATVHDLLRDIHLQNQAEQQAALHAIEHLKSLYDLKNTTNQ